MCNTHNYRISRNITRIWNRSLLLAGARPSSETARSSGGIVQLLISWLVLPRLMHATFHHLPFSSTTQRGKYFAFGLQQCTSLLAHTSPSVPIHHHTQLTMHQGAFKSHQLQQSPPYFEFTQIIHPSRHSIQQLLNNQTSNTSTLQKSPL